MKILITGASGFIGRHCLSRLLDHEIHATTLREPVQHDRVTWHRCDLHDHAAVEALIDRIRPTHLLHLAWYAHPTLYWRSLENYRWVASTLALLHAFGRHGRRAVIAGTSAEYDWRWGVCVEDVTPIGAANPYGICKDATRRLTASLAQSTGVSLAWARLFAVYGPGEPQSKLVSAAALAFASRRIFRIPADDIARDYIFVDDVARAFATLLTSSFEGVINIGSGEAVTIADVAGRVARELAATDLVERDAAYVEDTPLVLADVARLRGLGWSPATDLETGIRATIAVTIAGIQHVSSPRDD